GIASPDASRRSDHDATSRYPQSKTPDRLDNTALAASPDRPNAQTMPGLFSLHNAQTRGRDQHPRLPNTARRPHVCIPVRYAWAQRAWVPDSHDNGYGLGYSSFRRY